MKRKLVGVGRASPPVFLLPNPNTHHTYTHTNTHRETECTALLIASAYPKGTHLRIVAPYQAHFPLEWDCEQSQVHPFPGEMGVRNQQLSNMNSCSVGHASQCLCLIYRNHMTTCSYTCTCPCLPWTASCHVNACRSCIMKV